jgi:hypothetical protein
MGGIHLRVLKSANALVIQGWLRRLVRDCLSVSNLLRSPIELPKTQSHTHCKQRSGSDRDDPE